MWKNEFGCFVLFCVCVYVCVCEETKSIVKWESKLKEKKVSFHNDK